MASVGTGVGVVEPNNNNNIHCLLRSDGKRPDGLTQIPMEPGKCVTWDITVTDTFATSNINLSSAAAGAAAENSATKKVEKYSMLPECYAFVPLAFETMGPVCTEVPILLIR